MQSTNVRQIKEALVEQAFLGSTRVSCPIGPIVAVRRRKGQLLVMIRGWGRWYPVESMRIERMVVERHDPVGKFTQGWTDFELKGGKWQ
jgi:hypothetical protein